MLIRHCSFSMHSEFHLSLKNYHGIKIKTMATQELRDSEDKIKLYLILYSNIEVDTKIVKMVCATSSKLGK